MQQSRNRTIFRIQTTIGFIKDRDGGLVGSNHCVVPYRVYVYLEDAPNGGEVATLDQLSKSKGLWLTIWSLVHLENKADLEKRLAFISHDSKDKAEGAGRVAVVLQKLMCPVWYDEFSLKVGDHLRESLERGLKKAKKCVLGLSPNFFSNTGQTEFNSIFTRDILEQQSVVLPVWYKVTPKEVYEYSASLVDRVGLNWDRGGKNRMLKLTVQT